MSTITKKRPTRLETSSPDDFQAADIAEDLTPEAASSILESAGLITKTKPKKSTPKKKSEPKTVTGSGEGSLAAPKRGRGAPPGRRSLTDDPMDSRPAGHKGKVAVFYMVDDKHKWKIFGNNGRCIAVSGADFTTFAPAVESVRIITGTNNKYYKDQNGYQTIDLDVLEIDSAGDTE